MAKPPKKISTSNTSDTSLKPPSSTSDATPSTSKPSPTSDRVRGDYSGTSGRPVQTGDQSSGTEVSSISPGAVPQRPAVVTDMPVGNAITSGVAGSTIAWPHNRVDELLRIDDTGLFMSAEQTLYANVAEHGILRIEPNTKGDFQVHIRSTSVEPRPVLEKISGEPRWRIARQGVNASAEGASGVIQASDAPVKTLEIILPALAEKLTKADRNGLRYDKLKRTYVDVVEEGAVMVRKNAEGDYQATSASELIPSGPVLENIEDMSLWQRKPKRATPSEDDDSNSSKRPRMDENVETSDTGIGAEQIARPPKPNPYLWASWGKPSKPDAVDFVQISQLHYQTVPKGPLTEGYSLVFLQHPQFAPSRFDAFERMLHEAPSLQPVAATIRTGTDSWKVSGANPLFEKPLTQHVAQTFKGFTGDTSRAVAKRLFELSSGSEKINGAGLARMKQTVRYWEGKSAISVPGLGDPLDMLPVVVTMEGSRRTVNLRSPDSGETLQQLDFTPPQSWKTYENNPTAISLKTLFLNILNESGYDTFTPEAVTHLNSLVFRRPNHNKVYFLKLGTVSTVGLHIRTPPVPELADPLVINRMSAEMHQTLVAANTRNDVVWLIGGVQHLPSKSPSIFILRDR